MKKKRSGKKKKKNTSNDLPPELLAELGMDEEFVEILSRFQGLLEKTKSSMGTFVDLFKDEGAILDLLKDTNDKEED